MKLISFVLAASFVATSLFAATETLKFTGTKIAPGTEDAITAVTPGLTITKTGNTLIVAGATEATKAAIIKAAADKGLTLATATTTTHGTTTPTKK